MFLDLGSYQQTAHADTVQQQVAAIGLPIVREQAMVGGSPYQRVRSGPYDSNQEANMALDRIASLTGIRGHMAGY